MFSVLLVTYPGVEMMNLTVILCLVFYEEPSLQSGVASELKSEGVVFFPVVDKNSDSKLDYASELSGNS